MIKKPNVLVCGPASWNQLIELEQLPEPRPQQLAARRAWHTVGGTSAGKALHLTSLGVDAALFTPLGDDEPGRLLRRVLVQAGLHLQAVPSAATEQHVNLMAGGERLSIYVATPSTPTPADIDGICAALPGADLAVIDLSEMGLRVIERCGELAVPLWVDLHDYDGCAEFHRPFLQAASVVFMNNDATDDPWRLLAACLRQGPELAVCTLGAQGAVAMDRSGRRFGTPAPQVEVVDTNGAGDAFMAGFLEARLRRASVTEALEAGAAAAAVAISGRHLHPVLVQLLDGNWAFAGEPGQ